MLGAAHCDWTRRLQFELLARELLEPLREELAGVVAALRSSEGRWAGQTGSVPPREGSAQADSQGRRRVRPALNSSSKVRPSNPSLSGMAGIPGDMRDGQATGNDYVLIDSRDVRTLSAPPTQSPQRDRGNLAGAAVTKQPNHNSAQACNGDRFSSAIDHETTVPFNISAGQNRTPYSQRPLAGYKVDTDGREVDQTTKSRGILDRGDRPGDSSWSNGGWRNSLYATDGGTPMQERKQVSGRADSLRPGHVQPDAGGNDQSGDKEGLLSPRSLRKLAQTKSLTDCAEIRSARRQPVSDSPSARLPELAQALATVQAISGGKATSLLGADGDQVTAPSRQADQAPSGMELSQYIRWEEDEESISDELRMLAVTKTRGATKVPFNLLISRSSGQMMLRMCGDVVFYSQQEEG